MSITSPMMGGPVAIPAAIVPTGSTFKENLARRRKELEENVSFPLRIPGYDGLWGRYRVLGYEDMRAIGLEVEGEIAERGIPNPETAQATVERLTAAATLVTACEELLEYKGVDESNKPIFEALGSRWTLNSIRDLFEVDLPDGVAPREALLSVFPYPRDMLLVTHFNEYVAEGMSFIPGIEETMQGELRVPTPGT